MNEQKPRKEHSLEEIYKLTKENNRMLHAMRRDAFIGGILKFVFWIALFFVLPYILYTIYLQPYLESIQSAYSSFNESAGTLSEASANLEELQNQFPGVDFKALMEQFGIGN